MRNYQVLAPAGSVEQLVCAVNNGCDAVYLGLENFNARLKAPNFTAENISYWVDYCHFFGVKVYVTINTSIKNQEYQQAVDTLVLAYKSNADGVIVTDLHLLKLASTFPKPFEVVASTQLNVHDKYGADFLKKLGADTIVCARECTFEQIKEISECGVNVETFIHGALCVCQSGQCLLSSIIGGNSGNRGLCAQPCRKKYSANGGEFEYLLSAHDFCGIDQAKQLKDCGATTFKIEGRNRRPEYAGAASLVYKQLFSSNFGKSDEDEIKLREMYNRNMSSINYLQGENGEIIYKYCQAHSGVKVGTITNGQVDSYVYLNKGDGLKIFDGKREVCGGVVLENGKGIVKCSFDGKARNGCVVCRTTDVALCNQLANAKRKLDVKISFTAHAGSSACITATSGNVCCTVNSDFVVEPAIKRAVTEEEIKAQLCKTADFQYTITDIVVDIDNVFIAISQLNAIRRAVFEQLQSTIVKEYNSKFSNRNAFNCDNLVNIRKSNSNVAISVLCYDKQQVNACNRADFILYKPANINIDALSGIEKFVYLDLPPFVNLDYVEKVICGNNNVGIVCHNVGQVNFARINNVRYIAGSGLNIYNDYMANMFEDADTYVYSCELSLQEISSFANQTGLIFVDGKLSLMKLVHCPYKASLASSCDKCVASKRLIYKDELNNEFEIVRRKADKCHFELINGNKLSVISRLNKKGRYLVDYDTQVITHYVNLNNGVVDDCAAPTTYTKGRLYNKVN